MKIVVTGATGYVGRSLIPLLAENGAQLLLVGRNLKTLEHLFPNYDKCTYASLKEAAEGFDVIVHLAVLNSKSGANIRYNRSVNVEFALEVAKIARDAKIGNFVFVSSSHALNPRNKTDYAASKRDAFERLAQLDNLNVITVYLPMVYGHGWNGILAWLNWLPNVLANWLFRPIAAVKPTVHIKRFADFLLGAPQTFDVFRREIILSEPQSDNPWFTIPRRALDIGIAMSVLVLLWWLLALIWLAVRIQSPGPGIFAQKRVGQNGVVFTCYKFRTMHFGTAQTGTHQVSPNAVTATGRFLRRTKLDELPQVINILRNEMGLIGPRPSLPEQLELIDARRRCGVLEIKPGISGLAQINGSDMSDIPRLVMWDNRYMRLQSLLLDAKIIGATLSGRGQGDRIKGTDLAGTDSTPPN